ncbi:MAG TPA: isoprenylcysteine carboxylmethyltransferase family protein [Nitrospirota bacterium]
MLLRERIEKAGNFCFKFRSYQFALNFVALFLERDHISRIKGGHFYDTLCVLVVLAGLLIRAVTVGFVHDKTSGRNTKSQKAYELNTTGMYSLVRNPLYVANFLVLLGIFMLSQSLTVIIANAVVFAFIYVPIIIVEENFLTGQFGAAYLQYAATVNCFVPKLKGYIKPARKFSLLMVLRREHDTWMTAVVGLAGLKLLISFYLEGYVPGMAWLAGSCVVLFGWLLLKLLKKTGRLTETAQIRPEGIS